MVWFFTYDPWKVEGTTTRRMKCAHCDNTSDHEVFAVVRGPALGCILAPAKPLLSAKRYFLRCPVCGNPSKDLTKEQANALKGGE